MKEIVKLDSDDMTKLLKSFADKYLEKPKIVEDLEKLLKNNNLSEDEKKKFRKL
ncbi:hypothetical protein PL321_00810 [Caloramator sp. mosi_1]|uniref:hypothetical protein n=1 Tax=Caloramator sp. mosi_1 TaxID=3023090 RepID=UPI00236188DB|nr:hypothetical protein [Caloramator sp. mosi_1]WDC84398.1 hypothetical protein PL321_00810 [Caloramator sp. mosi_1]